MKTTIVPAQITTIEDRVTDRLSVSQLILLILPLVISTVTYILIPPILKLSSIKLIVSMLIILVVGPLAIRIKGRIVLDWFIILLRYYSRPGFFVYNKNDSRDRIQSTSLADKKVEPSTNTLPQITEPLVPLTIPALIRLENIVANPKINVYFTTTKKGGLYVHFTEVKKEAIVS